MHTIRVLLADDHALFRAGVRALLSEVSDIEVVGEAEDGEQAVAEARSLEPDVILMDLYMPGVNGLEATRIIKATLPQVRIVVLTVSDDDGDLFEAIKAGAHGYLVKKISPEILLETLRSVSTGEVLMPGQTANKILREFARLANKSSEDDTEMLSVRETEVLELVTKGETNKEIAASLFISENTVKNHLKNILAKLHLANRVQAAAFALEKGLIRRQDS